MQIVHSKQKTKRIAMLVLTSLVLIATSCAQAKDKDAPKANASGGNRAQTSLNNPDVDPAGRITLVELGSETCPPCKAMEPIRAKLKAEMGDRIHFVYYDVWTKEGEPHGMRYRARVIPTQVFLDAEGREAFRHEGFFSEQQIKTVFKRMGVE
jgi:thioredoxin 1